MRGTTSSSSAVETPARPRRWRKLVAWIIGLAFVGWAFSHALDPCAGGKEYLAIGHGSHSHYVPCPTPEEFDINRYPTSPPGPNERLLPDGTVVPR